MSVLHILLSTTVSSDSISLPVSKRHLTSCITRHFGKSYGLLAKIMTLTSENVDRRCRTHRDSFLLLLGKGDIAPALYDELQAMWRNSIYCQYCITNMECVYGVFFIQKMKPVELQIFLNLALIQLFGCWRLNRNPNSLMSLQALFMWSTGTVVHYRECMAPPGIKVNDKMSKKHK